MSPRLALLAAALLWSPALAAEPPPALQALTPTSGTGAELLLDGNPATGWRPGGSPAEEGVLLRLEHPTPLEGVSLRACAGAPAVKVAVYLDTAPHGELAVTAEQDAALKFERHPVRSVYLRLPEEAPAGTCLAEARLLQAGGPLALQAPRMVKGRIQASSVLAPADAYHPGYLFDGRPDFGWVEGAKGTGAGESLTLTLDAPLELVGLELWNGYQRSEDHFQKNARAKKLAVSVARKLKCGQVQATASSSTKVTT